MRRYGEPPPPGRYGRRRVRRPGGHLSHLGSWGRVVRAGARAARRARRNPGGPAHGPPML